MYLEAQQRDNGIHTATLLFYTSIRSFVPFGGFSFNQQRPSFSTLPMPFSVHSTPVFYYMPGDTVEFPASVSNQFVYDSMTLNNRLVGEFATPCNSAPCATISPLPGTTSANLLFQGKPTGSVMTFTGNDSSRLNFKFQWLPNFQHLDYNPTLQTYSSKLIPFYFHGYNTMCPTSVHAYQPFFISLFSPFVPLVYPENAQILPGDSCRVQAAASLDSTPTNANAIGVDFQIYRQKQSTYKMLAYLESSSSPFGTYQRCSASRTMTFNASSASFNVSLTDSSRSGLAAQRIWYRIVNLAYSGNTLVKTTTSQPFQALTNPGQLPVVQVKPDTVCVGVPARLVAVSSNGAQNPTYQWRYNGVVQSSITDVLDLPRLSANDSVRVEMTSRNGVANLNTVSSTVVRPAKIQPLIPRITRQGDSLVSSLSMSNQWYDLSAGLLPNDTLYWIKPTAGNFGPYTVVNRQQYCMVNSIDTVSFFPVQVQELTEGVIKLYPQPASAILNIQLPENILAQTVEIMDIQGKVIRRLEKAAETNLLILDTQPFSNGMYLIRTWIGGKEIRKKFLVQHR